MSPDLVRRERKAAVRRARATVLARKAALQQEVEPTSGTEQATRR